MIRYSLSDSSSSPASHSSRMLSSECVAHMFSMRIVASSASAPMR